MTQVSMDEVKRRVEEWRKDRRTARAPASPALRELVLKAKRLHGERATREALGLSSNTLWTWEREARSSGRSKMRSARQPRVTCGGGKRSGWAVTVSEPLPFVEVTPGSVLKTSEAELSLEWVRGDDARMRLSGATFDQAARLIEEFFSSADSAVSR